MEEIGFFGLILIGANILISYKGFKSIVYFDKYKFMIDAILIGKDYKRIATSGFLHVGWSHLIFNMISLYIFSGLVESNMGMLNFLLIYFASLIGGGLLSLYIHRNHGDYSAVGASGAVSGLVFASIALFPGLELGLIMIPGSIPSWLFGLLYIAISIYGIKSDRGNIGHDAHLGGALIGMLTAILLEPSVLKINYLPISLVLIPTFVFIYLILTRPHILIINKPMFTDAPKYIDPKIKWNEEKRNKELSIDQILDKINMKGIDSLTEKERKQLEEF